MIREPWSLWRFLIPACAGYAVFASVLSVGFTWSYGLSRWSLRPESTAIFPYLVVVNLGVWVGYALLTPLVFALGRRFPIGRHSWRRAVAIHVPASVLVTAGHLVVVATIRCLVQAARGGDPDWASVVAETLLRTIDLELPVYWALIGLQHAVDYHQQAAARADRAGRLEARLMESQLQALQQQLHPHFLFNTLHAISTLVHHDPDKADLMIERLSDLLRVTLRKVGVQEVELAQELDYLRAYLDIEQVHFGSRLRLAYRLEPAALDVMVPTLMLQPLVENAIRHGLEPLVRGGTLTIAAEIGDGALRLQIHDTGVGLPPQPTGRDDGVGLANTRARLERLYGDRAALTIRDHPDGGVVVDVHLPVRRAGQVAAAITTTAVA